MVVTRKHFQAIECFYFINENFHTKFHHKRKEKDKMSKVILAAFSKQKENIII